MKETKATRIFEFVVVAAVFLSVISQLPIFVKLGITRYLSFPAWIIMLIEIISSNKGRFSLKGMYVELIIAIIFFLFWLISIPFNSLFTLSAIPYAIAMTIFLLFCGNQLGPYVDHKLLRKIVWAYVLAALILGVAVFIEYFSGGQVIGRNYAYEEKNSTGLILLTGLILTVFTPIKKLKQPMAIKIFLVVGFIFMVVLMRSRAVYVSLAILFLVLVLNGKVDYKLKILFSVLIIGALIYFLTQEGQFNAFLDEFIFAGRDGDDLNDISSGRWTEWEHFADDLGDGWLFGNGRMKREAFVLTILLEFGIPIGILMMFFAITPVLKSLRYIKMRSDNVLLFFTLSLCYVVNMFFEQLAPFGPGVKCFFLWMLVGIFSSNPKLLLNSSEGGN